MIKENNMYRLLIRKTTGVVFRRYYIGYGCLELDASLAKFGRGIETVSCQKLTLFGWNTVFTDIHKYKTQGI